MLFFIHILHLPLMFLRYCTSVESIEERNIIFWYCVSIGVGRDMCHTSSNIYISMSLAGSHFLAGVYFILRNAFVPVPVMCNSSPYPLFKMYFEVEVVYQLNPLKDPIHSKLT